MNNTLKKLQTIPGVGKTIAGDFCDIGINEVEDLKGKNPEILYKQICEKRGEQVDRCMRYVCRSSVYFAEHKNPDSEKLKWWNWKDKK